MASYTSIGDSYQAAISCYKNFSWGYKTSKTILMRFHPSQEPSEKTKHPSPTSHIGICQVVKEVKTRVVATSRWGVPMGGLLEPSRLIMPTPFLQIFICHKKMVVEMGKGKNPPLFVKAWDIICLGSWETYHPPGSTSASTKKLSILRIPKRLPRELMRLKVFVLRSNAFMAKLPS